MNNRILTSLAGIAFCSVLLAGCGSSNTTTSGVTATTTTPVTTTTEFMIYPNSGSDNVQVAQVFLGPGSLELLASGSPTGDDPVFVKTAPNNQWVYEANNVSGNIFGFQINSSGVLTALPDGPYPGPSGIDTLSINSTGAFLFAAGTDEVSTLGITSTGNLTALSNVSLPLPAAPCAMVYTTTSAGTFLNIAGGNGTTAGISTYQVDATSGVLTLVSSYTTPGLTFSGLGVNSAGTIVFGALESTSTTGSVIAFNVGTGGALVANTPVALDGSPGELVLTTSGNLYVGTSNGTIDEFVSNSAGALTSLGTPFDVGEPINYLSLDPTQTLIYGSATANNAIYGFQIPASGILTSAANNPYQSSVSAPGHVDFSQFTITTDETI